MQVHGGQLHEVEPAGIHAPLREASIPHDAAVPETRSVPAPGEESLSEAPSVTREADYTTVIEALVIAALHALEAHVWDVKKRVAILQERIEEVAESPAVTAGYRDAPRETSQPLCAAPQPVSHAPHRAKNAGTG
jgi:hypothetical protein